MMVQYLLPPGLRGIVVAGLLSALMGSLAGVFNACSTLFTVDIHEKIRPKATRRELVRMGRLATLAMVKTIRGLALGTASEEARRRTRESWRWTDVAAPLVVMAFIIGACFYFRG